MTRRRTPYRIIQQHHISRDPEIIVRIFRSEHSVLTKLNRLRKSVPSWAFPNAVSAWLQEIEKRPWKSKRSPYLPSEMDEIEKENQKIKAERRKQTKLRVRRSK
jgi:uncharacterized FlgJ-related protein